MKYFSLIALFFILACNASDETEVVVTEDINYPDTIQAYDPTQFYIWDVNIDSMTKMSNPDIHPVYFNVDTLIKGLNARHPNVQLQQIDQSNDTLYLRIPDATYLTQQMGSYGAEQYIASVYLNLSSVNGINYVSLNFEEGDHARPGVLGPKQYERFRTVDYIPGQ